MGTGFLEIHLFVGNTALPVKNAKILVKNTNGNTIYELASDENGISKKVSLEAPDKKNYVTPRSATPYFNVYDVEIPVVNGYKRVIVHNVQIYDTITTILPVQLHPAIEGDTPEQNTDDIFIPLKHGVDEPREGFSSSGVESYAFNTITATERPSANEVKIPDYITVHLGSPNNDAARNVRVSFKDYIKNVASSEIFPFWDEAALYANIYCQISFVLNRTYTVWYRSRGKDFDITNNTAFDQAFVEGRDIFQNISLIVDRIFNMFIRRQGRREPFFASYCNGTTSQCDGLSQWGSQYLASIGYSYMEILKYYFPNDIQIVESNNFTTGVGTYPGMPLREGSSGEDVRTMQLYLNRISGNWYIPPIPTPDGIFGTATKTSVMEFQKVFNLIPDGIIGKGTWYQITLVYVAAKELAELESEGERISVGATPPTVTISLNSRGAYVVELQFLLNFISQFFPSVPTIVQNGVFKEETKRAVVEFQKTFGLTQDGVVGPTTWNKLYAVYHSIEDAVVIPPPSTTIPAFPGTALRVGSRGSDVLLMQNYLNAIARTHPSIPTLVADGAFGPATQASVIAFQRLFGLAADGIIGQQTWYKIIDVYNGLSGGGGTPQYPGTPLRVGSRGNDVLLMQNYLNTISKVFPSIPALTADGIFGTGTQSSVIAFQTLFGLTPDGVIGKYTWDKIVYVYNNLPNVAAPQFSGTALRVGSRGNDVTIMQKYLATIARHYPSIPTLSSDGIFGAGTERSVTAFQRQFGLTADGVIGRNTWNKIVSIYNLINMNMARANKLEMTSLSEEFKNNDFYKYNMLLALRMLRRY